MPINNPLNAIFGVSLVSGGPVYSKEFGLLQYRLRGLFLFIRWMAVLSENLLTITRSLARTLSFSVQSMVTFKEAAVAAE